VHRETIGGNGDVQSEHVVHEYDAAAGVLRETWTYEKSLMRVGGEKDDDNAVTCEYSTDGPSFDKILSCSFTSTGETAVVAS